MTRWYSPHTDAGLGVASFCCSSFSSTFFTSLLAAAIEDDGTTVERGPSGFGRLNLVSAKYILQQGHDCRKLHNTCTSTLRTCWMLPTRKLGVQPLPAQKFVEKTFAEGSNAVKFSICKSFRQYSIIWLSFKIWSKCKR